MDRSRKHRGHKALRAAVSAGFAVAGLVTAGLAMTGLATSMVVVSAGAAQAAPAHHHKARHVARVRGYGVGLAYAHQSRIVSHGHGHHYADLVGDPGSGYGFYPLPAGYRVAALRYHFRHQSPPWLNPVYYAINSQAAGYHPGTPGDWGYGGADMFNPIDGVGTPFFAGYYGPAGDEDEPPAFPFGRPYPPR